MREGLYESLISDRLDGELARLVGLTSSTGAVDEADEPHVLARYVGELLEARLRATRDQGARLSLVNELIEQLSNLDDAVLTPPRQLLSIEPPPGPGNVRSWARPRTPLSDAALLTNSSDEPSLGSELRAEIDSADEVDLLCAFVKWHGLRLLEPELERARERVVPLRVITTTYMGATERAALDRLVRQFGAEVKIQYDAQRTRLHAKAWMFRRGTGFDTAYVGSSNLSRAALLDGVEWNVRLSRVGDSDAARQVRAPPSTPTGTTPSFETYDPERDRDRLDDALAEASGARPRSRHDLTGGPRGPALPLPTGDPGAPRRRTPCPRSAPATSWSPPPAPARP